MNLYNLKLFADTARTASMTKAGELNHLSRPAVSQAIKKLEHELGVDLLVHQRRLVELTQAGRLLFKKSETLLADAENIARLVKQEKGPLIRDFRIGSSRTLATFNLPKVLSLLRDEYPEVSLQVHMANGAGLIKKLENREIDLAFLIGDDFLEGSKHIVVGRGHFVLVKPKAMDEHSVKYALTEKRPETERTRLLYERSHGHPLPLFVEIHSWDAIWQAVNKGICGGLVPDFLLRSKIGRGGLSYTVILPKVYPYEIKAIFSANRAHDPLVKSFTAHLKQTS